MQLVLALLLKCNCSVESKKINNTAESLWCFLMGAVKILDFKDSPWRKEFFRTLNTVCLKSCGLVKNPITITSGKKPKS